MRSARPAPFAQSAWRHLLFGIVLGELERRLNADAEFEPLEDVPVASNGHGNIEQAAAGGDDVHVGAGPHILGVGEVEHRLAVDDADRDGGDGVD